MKFKESMKITCPRCSALMVKRNGRYGEFLGCSRYPHCKSTLNLVKGALCCPKCGADLVKNEKKSLLECSSALNCNFILKLASTDRIACPRCDNPLVERTSVNGVFLGCSRYPSCKYLFDTWSNDNLFCPRCDSVLELELIDSKQALTCSNEECDFVFKFTKKPKKMLRMGIKSSAVEAFLELNKGRETINENKPKKVNPEIYHCESLFKCKCGLVFNSSRSFLQHRAKCEL